MRDRRAKGRLMVCASYLLAIVAFFGLPVMMSFIWLLLVCLCTLGMYFATQDDRDELRKWKDFTEAGANRSFLEDRELELCRLRRARRESIRAGKVEDDGLTDFGRELLGNPRLARHIREIKQEFGVSAGAETEDIFALEKQDLRIEAAWKRREAAEAAWEKITDRWEEERLSRQAN